MPDFITLLQANILSVVNGYDCIEIADFFCSSLTLTLNIIDGNDLILIIEFVRLINVLYFSLHVILQ